MIDQTTDALIRDLLAICERFATTPDHQGNWHLDNRENQNHTGVCCQRRKWKPSAKVVKSGTGFRPAHQILTGECAPSCQRFRAVLTAACEHVAAHEPRQLELIGGAA